MITSNPLQVRRLPQGGFPGGAALGSSRRGALPSLQNSLCALALGLMVVLAPGCSSMHAEKPPGRILLVDGRGMPVQGGVVLPDDAEANAKTSRQLQNDAEDLGWISDTQGLVHADLDQYLWDSDGCYHFRVRRGGYKDVEMSVSKDLFPPVLKIPLERATPDSAP
jgi:hypothetical protein